MGLDWIRIEDELPKDNGHVQKFLVCTDRRTSCLQNCNITTCYFTDRFRPEQSGIFDNERITHWAKIEKPENLL